MLDIERLKSGYCRDLSPDIDLIDESIASIESISAHMSDEEIYHHQRPLMISYLALLEAKERINRPE
ncbi:MAG: hypothetical protein IJL32_09280 [Oscillospiraceae bacterium]|nr:hypothetical protein [Oscillospiraceae bacterium]